MGDAEQANISRTLKSVDNTLKELVRVMTAINENMVTVGRTVNNWFESIEDVSVQVVPPKQHKENPMPDQPSEKDQNDAVEVQSLVADINQQQQDAGRDTTITNPD